MRFPSQRQTLALLSATWLLSVVSSCSEGPGIAGANGTTKPKGTELKNGDGDGKGGGDDVGELAGGGSLGSQSDGGGDAQASYPVFRYNGKGNSLCGSMNHVTTINVESSYTVDAMIVKKTNSKVYCDINISGSDGVPDDKCNEIANSAQSIDKRNQETTYLRLKGADLKKAQDEGLKFVPYAVFAKEIRMGTGRVITLSKPLPVGVLPAAAGRYKSIETKSWSASASDGQLTFDVTVEIAKVSQSDSQVQLRVAVTIPQAASDYTLYESWPMPAAATYAIDTDAQSITQIDAQSKNGSGGQSRCTNTDTSTTTLMLCDKVLNGETKAGSCTFGANAL